MLKRTCIVVDSISIVDISVSFSVSYVIVWYIIIKDFNIIGNKNWKNVTECNIYMKHHKYEAVLI